MDDKNFYLNKIKINIPQAYDFAKKYYELINIDGAGHNLDRKQFCLRLKESALLTKEMLGELILIKDFDYVYLTRWNIDIQFKK